MESNRMDEFLKKQMSADDSGISEPSLGLVRHARSLISQRKKHTTRETDIFYAIARFLNLHVKLSYVVILVFCCGLASLYFTEVDVNIHENISSPSVVNIASARSSTVLSSIVTFESRH